MGPAGIPPFVMTPVRVTMRVPRRCTCRGSSIHRSSLAGDSTGERMENPAVGARWQDDLPPVFYTNRTRGVSPDSGSWNRPASDGPGRLPAPPRYLLSLVQEQVSFLEDPSARSDRDDFKDIPHHPINDPGPVKRLFEHGSLSKQYVERVRALLSASAPVIPSIWQ